MAKKKFTVYVVKRQAIEISARDEDEAAEMVDDMIANDALPENWDPPEVDDIEGGDDIEDDDD